MILPVGVHDSSGIAPVSQIMFPLGWAIRKHAMDMSVVVTSSFFKLNRPISELCSTPQSNTYRRTLLGGFGLCEAEDGACARTAACGAKNTIAAAAMTKIESGCASYV